MKIGTCALFLTLSAIAARADDAEIYRPPAGASNAPAEAPAPAPLDPASLTPAPAVTTTNSSSTTTTSTTATPAPAPAAPAPAPAPQFVIGDTYTVQNGDSLWKIAHGFNVSIKSLKAANNLTNDNIRVGRVLQIPNGGRKPEEVRKAQPLAPAPTPRPAASAAPKPNPLAEQVALQKRFVEETKEIALRGVGYNRDWRPPGEANEWAMDCSNTTRYLYKKVAGIGIDRTASDQYYSLQQKGLAWEAPRAADGDPDLAALSRDLRVGDLLFWENTYKPERTPPITHVMIYLGQNKEGQWLMAGSQMGSGFFNLAGSGPDVYVFKPKARIGGFSTNLGFTHVKGRFVAFGRPLSDKAGVALAGN